MIQPTGTLTERKARFIASMKEANIDDLQFVRGEIAKKAAGGLSRIADAESETAREFIQLIDDEIATRPALALTRISAHGDQSEETTCFNATMKFRGEDAGTVSNTGRGACHSYNWTSPAMRDRVEEWAKLQPTAFDFEKLDQVINGLLVQAGIEVV
jgi:hypothetical protein